jgi:polyketide synthase 12/myxalamid-type polyketide synthase MxaB
VPDLRDRLNELPSGRRRAFLRTEIRQQAAVVLGLAPDYPIDADQPLNEIGLDSLMAVELRNALGAMIEQSLPATLLYERPTIVALTDFLAGEVLPAEEPVATGQPVKPIDISNDDLDELSEDEMAELLHRQLKGLKDQ